MFDTLRANKLLLGKFKDIKFLIKLKFASFNFMAFIADISLKVCNIIMLLIMWFHIGPSTGISRRPL